MLKMVVISRSLLYTFSKYWTCFSLMRCITDFLGMGIERYYTKLWI